MPPVAKPRPRLRVPEALDRLLDRLLAPTPSLILATGLDLLVADQLILRIRRSRARARAGVG